MESCSIENMQMCEICSVTQKPKYKCPRCKTRYCSVNCCKIHKDQCSANIASLPTADIIDIIDTNSSELMDSSVEEERLLTDVHKNRLQESLAIKDILRSKKLQNVLTLIDNAPDRQKALRRARQDPYFEEFITLLLQGR